MRPVGPFGAGSDWAVLSRIRWRSPGPSSHRNHVGHHPFLLHLLAAYSSTQTRVLCNRLSLPV
jgi:hypothetical protein